MKRMKKMVTVLAVFIMALMMNVTVFAGPSSALANVYAITKDANGNDIVLETSRMSLSAVAQVMEEVGSDSVIAAFSLLEPSAGVKLPIDVTFVIPGVTEDDNMYIKYKSGNKWKKQSVKTGKRTVKATIREMTDIVVVRKADSSDSVKATGITLSKETAELQKGKSLNLKATINPSYATNKDVAWISSDEKVLKVSDKGRVTAVGYGKATITAKAKDGSNAKVKCSITVSYNIKYKLNGGTNDKKNPDTYYNQKIILKNPVRRGYAFKGWYTDKNYKKKITAIQKGTKKNYTLYAKWQKITVKVPEITSVKNNGKNQVQVKYKQSAGADGYEVAYTTDKSFKKSVTTETQKNVSHVIKNLKKGKTYFVKVRAYQYDSAGNKIYSKYTKSQKVKVVK